MRIVQLIRQLLGIKEVPIRNDQQRSLSKGWYHIRASANCLEDEVRVELKQESNTIMLLETTADWLPNLRYRTYFYTSGGALRTSGLTFCQVESFPAWQVRARSVLRESRQHDVMAAVRMLFRSRQQLIEYHRQTLTRRDVLASLSQYAASGTAFEVLRLVNAFEPQLEPSSKSESAVRRYVIVSLNDLSFHPAVSEVVAQVAHDGGFPPVMFSQHVTENGECVVKPEFDPVLYATYDFIGPAVFFREDVYRASLSHQNQISPELIHATVMESVIAGHQPVRIDEFLVKSERKPAELSEVSTHYESLKTTRGNYSRIRQWDYSLANPPLVSVIVPTYNGLAVLKPCIESLLNTCNYPNTEIIIVDNNSDDSETLAYLSGLTEKGVRVIRYPFPFNYSAINNFAVRHAQGEFLCLLNNDVEVIEPAWLSKMVCWAQLSSVGAVGARLLYGNGRIQHAGVVVGMGNAAGHLHRLETQEQPHHCKRISLSQMVTAVTAACLVVRRDKFERVGGLNEEQLAVAYNDIDLCLKLNRLGYQSIYCADAVLYHHESVSRGDDLSSEKIKRYMRELKYFQKRWAVTSYQDRAMSKHWDQHMERVPKLRAPVNAFDLHL